MDGGNSTSRAAAWTVCTLLAIAVTAPVRAQSDPAEQVARRFSPEYIRSKIRELQAARAKSAAVVANPSYPSSQKRIQQQAIRSIDQAIAQYERALRIQAAGTGGGSTGGRTSPGAGGGARGPDPGSVESQAEEIRRFQKLAEDLAADNEVDTSGARERLARMIEKASARIGGDGARVLEELKKRVLTGLEPEFTELDDMLSELEGAPAEKDLPDQIGLAGERIPRVIEFPGDDDARPDPVVVDGRQFPRYLEFPGRSDTPAGLEAVGADRVPDPFVPDSEDASTDPWTSSLDRRLLELERRHAEPTPLPEDLAAARNDLLDVVERPLRPNAPAAEAENDVKAPLPKLPTWDDLGDQITRRVTSKMIYERSYDDLSELEKRDVDVWDAALGGRFWRGPLERLENLIDRGGELIDEALKKIGGGE